MTLSTEIVASVLSWRSPFSMAPSPHVKDEKAMAGESMTKSHVWSKSENVIHDSGCASTMQTSMPKSASSSTHERVMQVASSMAALSLFSYAIDTCLMPLTSSPTLVVVCMNSRISL